MPPHNSMPPSSLVLVLEVLPACPFMHYAAPRIPACWPTARRGEQCRWQRAGRVTEIICRLSGPLVLAHHGLLPTGLLDAAAAPRCALAAFATSSSSSAPPLGLRLPHPFLLLVLVSEIPHPGGRERHARQGSNVWQLWRLCWRASAPRSCAWPRSVCPYPSFLEALVAPANPRPTSMLLGAPLP
jgi:hypothetical protein